MLTVINEPSQYFSIYKDYNFKYNSDINSVINFKYKITYDEFVSGTIYNNVDTFERFPEPDGTTTFNLRKYLGSKINSDYFPNYYSLSDGLYPNPLNKNFRLRIQEEYAYQFPWGIFNGSGTQIGTGVSPNLTKCYGIYNLKLTYTNPLGQASPLFQVGSVI